MTVPPLRVLPDVLCFGLRVVFCGMAAGTKSAQVGAYYAGRANSFWSTLYAVSLTPRLLAAAEFKTSPDFGIGLTDIAKFRMGVDKTLCNGDFDVAGLRAKIEHYALVAIAFNGKMAASVFYDCDTEELDYGEQGQKVGNAAVWILPSTSSTARKYWDVHKWMALAGALRHATPPVDSGGLSGCSPAPPLR